MKLKILQIKLAPNYTSDSLQEAVAKRLNLQSNEILNITIDRRSIDARDRLKGEIYYIFNITAEVNTDLNIEQLWQVTEIKEEPDYVLPECPASKIRPVVIGAGPAGLFAALTLAKNGLKPIIYERGKEVKERKIDVGLFWGQGIINHESNVLYGEGGAGTFSDGKITSRSKDRRRTRIVRQTFFDAGAAKEVLYDAAFHIGSDKLAQIIPTIRKQIINLGGEFHFNSKLSRFNIENGKLAGLIINNQEIIADKCFLATGHSAYDTYNILELSGAELDSKPFATGVRVEIPQSVINLSQYGNTDFLKQLGSASFSLTLGKDCYSFCMCPGGKIIPCSTEAGSLFTNGMSLSTRTGQMGNAAFLLPQKFDTFSDGYQFIKRQENAAYNLGNRDFSLPLTTVKEFPYSCKTLPETRSCNRSIPADFTKILPEKMCDDLKIFIPKMLTKMKGVEIDSAIIAGPETRSSSPVRVVRNEKMECTKISGLYPIGEGAGYAGGIMSSAIDGIKSAEISMI